MDIQALKRLNICKQLSQACLFQNSNATLQEEGSEGSEGS